MTTIDQIRARHAHNCAGSCDVAYLLAELDAAGRLLHTAYLANNTLREQNDMQARRIDHLVSSVRSLRQQRTYLVRQLNGQRMIAASISTKVAMRISLLCAGGLKRRRKAR